MVDPKRTRLLKGRRVAALCAVAALAGPAIGIADDDDGSAGVRAHPGAHTGTAHHTELLGRSVRGRPIRAVVIGDPHSTATALVVGCIHGSEPGGILVANRLRHWRPPAGSALWIVPTVNPDGVSADTRQNARGVDLNRNFPYRWRPLGPPGSQQYSGTGPLSEPESRISHSLILRIRPRLTIWFHQPLGLTDRSGGDTRLEQRFAALSRLPLRQLPRYPGSITTWQDFRLRDGTAFVVELPPGRPASAAVNRYTRAVERVAAEALAGDVTGL